MPGLPDGWEADYDGKRWFYRYLPSGHVQYHFPSEGDEYPDFIDVSFPAPALAPEERLESQQQIKRQGGGIRGLEVPAGNKGDGMTASARPVSAVWDEEGESEESGFRPENFMFLGPGGYDVSPLPEEEDEIVKKTGTGPEESAMNNGVSLESSPAMSRKSPKMDSIISEAVSPAPSTAAVSPPQDPAVPSPATGVAVCNKEPIIRMIDSREVAVELSARPHDPVGKIPEMASGETAKAYIEIHPDPVEIADNTILAPIETKRASLDGWTALPSKAQPTSTTQDQLDTVQVKGSPTSSISAESGEVNVATELKYKPYKPGQVQTTRPRSGSDERRAFQASLQREKSLLMGSVDRLDQTRESTPSVLSESGPRPSRTSPLTHRQHPPSLSIPGTLDQSSIVDDASPALIKYPSVLRPARGRALSQPTAQSRAERPANLNAEQGNILSQAQSQPVLSRENSANEVSLPGPPLPPKIPTLTSSSASLQTTPAQITPHVPLTGSSTRKAVPVRTNSSWATSSETDPTTQSRRHSSFSPVDYSHSRSGRVPLSTPQSSPGDMRRGSSTVSLAQSLSHITLFTPSPQSLTPVSGGYSDLVSPISGRSSKNHLRSGSEQSSYFTAADTISRSSNGQGVHRSESARQSPTIMQPQPPVNGRQSNRMSMQASPSVGNLLNSIREQDEMHLPHGSRPAGPSKRHSMVPAIPFSQFGPSLDAQKPARASPHPPHHQQAAEQPLRSQAPPMQTAPYPLSSDMRPEPVMQQLERVQSRSYAPNQAPPGRLTKQPPASAASQELPHAQIQNQQGAVPTQAAPAKEKENKFKKWFKGSKTSAPAEAQVPPPGHPHAPPSGWHANSAIPRPPKDSILASGTMPWSPGQIQAATFAHHSGEAGSQDSASRGPNVLHKQRPGYGQQVRRPQVDYEYYAAMNMPGEPYRGGGQDFGGPPNGQHGPEPPMYGSAVDL